MCRPPGCTPATPNANANTHMCPHFFPSSQNTSRQALIPTPPLNTGPYPVEGLTHSSTMETAACPPEPLNSQHFSVGAHTPKFLMINASCLLARNAPETDAASSLLYLHTPETHVTAIYPLSESASTSLLARHVWPRVQSYANAKRNLSGRLPLRRMQPRVSTLLLPGQGWCRTN